MASVFSQANLYELSGDGTVVTYTPAGFGGAPQLTYRSGDQDLVFRDRDVRTTATEIGTLVGTLRSWRLVHRLDRTFWLARPAD